MSNGKAIQIKCIIVDDEPMARDVVRRYIQKIPTLKLMGEFGNAIEATIFLQEQPVDMIFLDIKMPQLSGTEFVRSLRNVPKIIFTTAHKEFAHEGFELDVIDYLLKPVEGEDIVRAIKKIKNDIYKNENSIRAQIQQLEKLLLQNKITGEPGENLTLVKGLPTTMGSYNVTYESDSMHPEKPLWYYKIHFKI